MDYWGNFLKVYLTYSYCTKHYEINVCHFDKKKHDFFKNDRVQAHTKVFLYIMVYKGICLKHILAYLNSAKYDEINTCHSAYRSMFSNYIDTYVTFGSCIQTVKFFVFLFDLSTCTL